MYIRPEINWVLHPLFFTSFVIKLPRSWGRTNLVLNLIEKQNLVSYFHECVYFLNRMGWNSDLTPFTSKIQILCKPEWTKKETPWKWILTIFEYKNEYPKQSSKSRWKKCGHLYSFLFLLPELWSLNCPK